MIINITDINEKFLDANWGGTVALWFHVVTFTLNQFSVHRLTNQLLSAHSKHHITTS